MHLHRYLVSIITLILALTIISQWKFDNNWNRPINSDGKGYYAFLPAIFIYQDFSYSFVDEIETKYYSEDGSQAKAFRMKQPNGTVVNKCFPGTAVFYLPFFLLALVFSWILGFPLDGYSALFQWSVAIAHLFYLFWGLFALKKAMKTEGLSNRAITISILLLVFATNLFYYLVFDFTVAHVFGLSGACVFIYLTVKYKSSQDLKYIAWLAPLLALLLITRPTNLLLVFILPLLLNISEIKMIFNLRSWINFKHITQLILSLAILFIAPLLWKIQSGNWLVYSYGNEKIDLTNPHFIDFLTSYLQGWWLWTPLMFVAFLFGSIYFWSQSKWTGFIFSFGILSIVYIFSSWSTWTFGMSFGQRPMIEFYPILIIGFAGFIASGKWKLLNLIFVPFVILNVIQAYQVRNFILVGGDTNKEQYWNHFLKLKPDPPFVEIRSNWKEIQRKKSEKNEVLSKNSGFSANLTLKPLKKGSKVVVLMKIGGIKDKTGATIVLSDATGEFYLDRYIHNDLDVNPTTLSYLFEIDQNVDTPIKCYIWNGNSNEEVQLESFEIIQYMPNN